MTNNYKIIEQGKDNKVLVAWEREKDMFFPQGVEYSVHTVSVYGNLIWGHYFIEKSDAIEYFKQYKY